MFKAVLSFKGSSLKQKMFLIKALWSLLPFTATTRGSTQHTQTFMQTHTYLHPPFSTNFRVPCVCILTSTEYFIPAIRWLRSLWGSFASCSYLTKMEWLENGERFISPDIFNSDVLLKAITSGFFPPIPFFLIEALWLLGSWHFPVPIWPTWQGIFRTTRYQIVLGIGKKNDITSMCTIQN